MTSDTPLDHFEYGTWEMTENQKGGTIKRLGFRQGPLALLRINQYCENCEKLHETWAVANLAAAAYMFPGAVFHNVDDGLRYVDAIISLAKWDTATVDVIRKVADTLVALCIKNNGIPTTLLAFLENDPSALGDVVPGTIAGLNGYTKQ